MLRALFASDPPSLCTAPSFLGGALAGIVLLSTAAGPGQQLRALKSGDTPDPRASERVVYLLPPIPTERQPDSSGLSWAPADAKGNPDGTRRGGKGHGGGGRGVAARVSGHVEVEVPGPGYENEVFAESQVDEPVIRDPGSAAPAYPPALIELRIEGSITVEYVVDTTGFADSASLHVVQASNPAFVESLRAALPHMHFTPATMGGRKVRQWVRQDFVFRIPAIRQDNTAV